MFEDQKIVLFLYRSVSYCSAALLVLFGDNKVKTARKPGKKQGENPVACTGEGKG